MIDPATVATGISLTKTAAELGKKLNEFYSEIKDREIRKKLDEVIDQLRDLKQRAAELEDEVVALVVPPTVLQRTSALGLNGDAIAFRSHAL